MLHKKRRCIFQKTSLLFTILQDFSSRKQAVPFLCHFKIFDDEFRLNNLFKNWFQRVKWRFFSWTTLFLGEKSTNKLRYNFMWVGGCMV